MGNVEVVTDYYRIWNSQRDLYEFSVFPCSYHTSVTFWMVRLGMIEPQEHMEKGRRQKLGFLDIHEKFSSDFLNTKGCVQIIKTEVDNKRIIQLI